MVRSSGCRSVKPGKSAALLAYTTQRPMSLDMKLCLKLLLRKTCGYFLYSFAMSWAIHIEHNWASPRGHHTPMTTRRPTRGLNTPATDQNQCRRTSIYERSVISGSYSGRKRDAHYTFLQHLMQIITICHGPGQGYLATWPTMATCILSVVPWPDFPFLPFLAFGFSCRLPLS